MDVNDEVLGVVAAAGGAGGSEDDALDVSSGGGGSGEGGGENVEGGSSPAALRLWRLPSGWKALMVLYRDFQQSVELCVWKGADVN